MTFWGSSQKNSRVAIAVPRIGECARYHGSEVYGPNPSQLGSPSPLKVHAHEPARLSYQERMSPARRGEGACLSSTVQFWAGRPSIIQV